MRVVTRPVSREREGRMITLALHSTRRASSARPGSDECFFQVGFRVEGTTREEPFVPLEHMRRDPGDEEAASLELLYRNRLVFGTGHGCAANWEQVQDGGTRARRATTVSTSTLPRVKIPPIEPRARFNDAHDMELLSGEGLDDPAQEIPRALAVLVDAYEAWIVAREGELGELEDHLARRGEVHMERCRIALERMRHGLELLETHETVRQAFMMANQAILAQQYHVHRPRRALEEDWTELPASHTSVHDPEQGVIRGYWRSFQIAFLLMNLESALEPDPEAARSWHDEVDLIWFPTGGGKTEAYLGLSAYMIFMSRLEHPGRQGCLVLMRYTLRLLTAQQFQRACAMICACEHMRREQPDLLGEVPISAGLWVGKSLTPNRRDASIKQLGEWRKKPGEAENPFQLLTCPWCGTALDDPGQPGYRVAGWPETVVLACPEPRCDFHQTEAPLPVKVIDEDIYERPPTLIIGTVDKFAMLTWRDDAGRLLGLAEGLQAPALIIQDELHLISGPLGTVVGLYESMIEHLCRRAGGHPRIVASTATIRRADEQCQALYDREAFVFPPSGLDASDNFFAVEQRGPARQRGRQYMGVMLPAAPSPITALVRTASGLLQGIRAIDLPEGQGEQARDPWWTLVMYFNSLRELGRAATLVEGDIPEHIRTIQRRRDIKGDRRRWVGRPVELTSRRSAQEIPEILEDLSRARRHQEDRVYDTLLATNMISVGVDVDRLGLMLVVGQPKTTSEYIQASSRVGRSASAPGLVVTLYHPGKPRDRSHYEHFRDYHESFYRHVEPTSVTPFSPPAIRRALHALLVILARHVVGVDTPDALDPKDPAFEEGRAFLLERARSIDPDHVEYLQDHLEERLEEWVGSGAFPPEQWGTFGPPPEERPLMYPAGSTPRPDWMGQSWSMPTSMRNVDASCLGKIVQVYPGARTRRGD